MKDKLNYTLDCSNNQYIIKVDPVAMYGYYETREGTLSYLLGGYVEGGLWFEEGSNIPLVLTDFDGASEIPTGVISGLRRSGKICVPSDFEQSL